MYTVDQVSNIIAQLPAEAGPRITAVMQADGTFVLKVPDDLAASVAAAAPSDPRAFLVGAAAAKRWRVQTGGISVGGFPVRTDDKTRTEIGLARADADTTPGWVTSWKLSGGLFVTVDAAMIRAIGAAVSTHIRECFDAEALIVDDIASGTITTLDEIETDDRWPENG